MEVAHVIIMVMAWLAGLVMLALLVLFVQDLFQTKSAVRRNFPVIGRLRYFLERQGEYFRQYFFADDREELPFNRATRSWVYRTAKNMAGTIGFGSTNDLREPGSIIFINSPYPMLEEECEPTPPLVIGPHCRQPFTAGHIVNISGMSFGALSVPAVRALSQGAARAGVWLNTGEGGLSPYHLEGQCDLIYQIGTAKYGVRDADGRLSDTRLRDVARHVRAFEIKLAQGAKPGKGGILPAIKVNEEVARIRGIPVRVASVSPNRHVEVKVPDDLLDMIQRIREETGLPVGIKTVIGSAVYPRQLCEAILRRGADSAPDFITVDGGEGGSGAAPQVLADHVGLPLTESLPILVDVLDEAGLRERIRVIASGKLVTSAKVAWALCVGADFIVTARGFMFALGCIQSMQCHQDTCPTGVTTHNKRLQKGLVVSDKAARVANYARCLNHDVDVLAHSCGLRNARQFSRRHARIVQSAGNSVPLDELYPYHEGGPP
ncbi:MAG TPA: FMN-binding glutamate synthase family protein [Gammaproteobacteria bacterium]|nr:FMN-binding glutamate synthase family protein [Gammaproteobacteria bacterium]